MKTRPARLAVLASGTGSNLQAILDACACGDLDAAVVCVVSDRCGAKALSRAEDAQVPSVVYLPPAQDPEPRTAWDARLADVVAESRPDWIILAGFMRLLSRAFLDRFPGRVVNLHPALPGELPGARAIERAFEEFAAGQRTKSGVMVHLVPDEGVDCGPVVAVEDVPIHEGDDVETFANRMHRAEHALLVSCIGRLIAEHEQHEALQPKVRAEGATA